MRTNVFLRSTRRQPVRTVFLLLVTALVTFTFVGRVSEYLLIKQETARLAEYYRAIGTLEAGDGIEQALTVLENSPYVQSVERRRFVSAVIENGYCNADTEIESSMGNRDMFFCGVLDSAGPDVFGENFSFVFTVDRFLTGLPEWGSDGMRLTLTGSAEDLAETYASMEPGTRYLVRCTPRLYIEEKKTASFLPLTAGDSAAWYIALPEEQGTDLSAFLPAEVWNAIQEVYANQRALSAIPTRDMTVLPETQELSQDIFLTAGRWLDQGDSGARACVIHAGFAKTRGLQVGDSIGLRLRDIQSNFGYSSRLSGGSEGETAPEPYEIVGVYDFTARYASTCVRNLIYIPASAVPDSFVCGTELSTGQRLASDRMDSSTGGALPLSGDAVFLLKGPEWSERFLSEAGAELNGLGFAVRFVDNHWENFYQSVTPMRRSSLFNVILYAVILLVALCLTDFIYFRARGKELAIVRAMGLPVKRSVRESILPLFLIAMPGVLFGGALGWWNTLRNAEETFSALAELDVSGVTSAALSPVYLALLWTGILALVLALTLGCAVLLAKKPILEQLQGGTQAAPKQRRRTASAPPPPNAAGMSLEAVRAVRMGIPAERSCWRRAAVMVRFVWRQIARAPVKTALAAALAAVFAVGLGAIQLSIERDTLEINWLYETTRVSLEFVPKDGAKIYKSGGFLFGSTVEEAMSTGLLEPSHLEAANEGIVLLDPSEEIAEGSAAIHIGNGADSRGQRLCLIRSTDDGEAFFSDTGTGANMAVTYFDGWDSGLFAQDWSGDEPIPVIIPQKWSARYASSGRDRHLAEDTIFLSCRGSSRLCVVAGVHDEAGESTVLLPTSALKSMVGERILYSKASFTIDPSRNRDLETFRAALEAITDKPRTGSVPTGVVIRDEELTEAVAPLEESLELMRILYPVVFVLSLLTAAGTAALFVMMSAKDAATLRVLGTPKGRTQLILVLQQTVTCFAGLVLGVAGMLAYIQKVRPDLIAALAAPAAWRAAAYLAAAVAGAAISSVAITRKNPLEMLQVKE